MRLMVEVMDDDDDEMVLLLRKPGSWLWSDAYRVVMMVMVMMGMVYGGGRWSCRVVSRRVLVSRDMC